MTEKTAKAQSVTGGARTRIQREKRQAILEAGLTVFSQEGFRGATLDRIAAEAGLAYDQMLARGNAAGEELIMTAVDALVTQTRGIERAVSALGLDQIGFEGSDSLDNPDAVFQ